MPTTIKNDKGLFGNSGSTTFDAVAFEAIAALAREHPGGAQWADATRALTTRHNNWRNEADYPQGHRLAMNKLLGGFSNETCLWPESSREIRDHWTHLLALRSEWSALSKKIAATADPQHMLDFEHNFPKKTTLERALACVFTDLEPGWEAAGGEAWAIWMGSAREQGYMDDKKRPAGSASARLFESAAAAARTAKAAKFGSDRGPAAIVRLRVECLAIASSDPGAACEAPRMVMAARESQEIRDSLEEATLDDIRRALGEPAADHAPREPAAPPAEGSLAGREEGYACWVDWERSAGYQPYGSAANCGFVNIRGGLGPLTGAVLKEKAKAAEQKSGYWSGRTSVIKVGCWPIAIDDLIGEPNVSSLRSAIAWEAEQAALASLAKQDDETLRSRAAALESGQATPRKRSRSL